MGTINDINPNEDNISFNQYPSTNDQPIQSGEIILPGGIKEPRSEEKETEKKADECAKKSLDQLGKDLNIDRSTLSQKIVYFKNNYPKLFAVINFISLGILNIVYKKIEKGNDGKNIDSRDATNSLSTKYNTPGITGGTNEIIEGTNDTIKRYLQIQDLKASITDPTVGKARSPLETFDFDVLRSNYMIADTTYKWEELNTNKDLAATRGKSIKESIRKTLDVKDDGSDGPLEVSRVCALLNQSLIHGLTHFLQNKSVSEGYHPNQESKIYHFNADEENVKFGYTIKWNMMDLVHTPPKSYDKECNMTVTIPRWLLQQQELDDELINKYTKIDYTEKDTFPK